MRRRETFVFQQFDIVKNTWNTAISYFEQQCFSNMKTVVFERYKLPLCGSFCAGVNLSVISKIL